jgi:hypothetical protein
MLAIAAFSALHTRLRTSLKYSIGGTTCAKSLSVDFPDCSGRCAVVGLSGTRPSTSPSRQEIDATLE